MEVEVERIVEKIVEVPVERVVINEVVKYLDKIVLQVNTEYSFCASVTTEYSFCTSIRLNITDTFTCTMAYMLERHGE